LLAKTSAVKPSKPGLLARKKPVVFPINGFPRFIYDTHFHQLDQDIAQKLDIYPQVFLLYKLAIILIR
jgi:hypothetical protein